MKNIMENSLNLCELLKGHEGEMFYSPLCGYIELNSINKDSIFFKNKYGRTVTFTKSGNYFFNEYPDTECLIFPSKEQRDWNKWPEEQKYKVPKIWSEAVNAKRISITYLSAVDQLDRIREDETPILKSAIAFIKIHRLIESCYGGNITEKEWEDRNITKYCIEVKIREIKLCDYSSCKTLIAFHTPEQRKEFMSYPENIQLVYDYYMIEP